MGSRAAATVSESVTMASRPVETEDLPKSIVARRTGRRKIERGLWGRRSIPPGKEEGSQVEWHAASLRYKHCTGRGHEIGPDFICRLRGCATRSTQEAHFRCLYFFFVNHHHRLLAIGPLHATLSSAVTPQTAKLLGSLQYTIRTLFCLTLAALACAYPLDPSASATLRRQHVGAQDAHHQPTLGRSSPQPRYFSCTDWATRAQAGPMWHRLLSQRPSLSHVRFVLPNAPIQPVTLQHGHAHRLRGFDSRSSYSFLALDDLSGAEDEAGPAQVDRRDQESSSRPRTTALHRDLTATKSPSERIVVGGFQPGAAPSHCSPASPTRSPSRESRLCRPGCPLRAKIAALRAPHLKEPQGVPGAR
ncbi:hypothetical protein L1887_58205 [Cichorium endivia]|nr:hypothetical protein L1887_58205 [Cichorium endivia]